MLIAFGKKRISPDSEFHQNNLYDHTPLHFSIV